MADDENDLGDFTDSFPSIVTDRNRGIFTKQDREYLTGEKELEGQDERNARYRIRQRVLQALIDIRLLVDNDTFPRKDLEQVANNDDLGLLVSSGNMAPPLPSDLILLAYDLLDYSKEIQNPDQELEEAISQALLTKEKRKFDGNEPTAIIPSVEINIDTEPVDAEEMAKAFVKIKEEEGANISPILAHSSMAGDIEKLRDKVEEELPEEYK